MLEPFTLDGSFVRLEPLSEAHIAPLVAAAAEDRAHYQWTVTPQGHEQTAAYVAETNWRRRLLAEGHDIS